MKEFSGYAHPIPGGWWAMTRFARDAKPKPLLGKGEKPDVFPDKLSATKTALQHVLAYLNGHLVCSGEIKGDARKARPKDCSRTGERSLSKVWRRRNDRGALRETGGSYFGLKGVDPWDEVRDARKYDGPWPVVAHPPCQRWGRFWHGSTRKPHQYRLGADYGCFAAALTAVRNFGGVLEHPKDSMAWSYFGLTLPPTGGGWMQADAFGGWTCCVDQGHCGHFANKRTWLYAVGCELPSLAWGKDAAPRPHPQGGCGNRRR